MQRLRRSKIYYIGVCISHISHDSWNAYFNSGEPWILINFLILMNCAQAPPFPTLSLVQSQNQRAQQNIYNTKKCMRSPGNMEVAAMDSCFALIRARQHCIAKHYWGAKSFHSALYFKVKSAVKRLCIWIVLGYAMLIFQGGLYHWINKQIGWNHMG